MTRLPIHHYEAEVSVRDREAERMGFFTDTTVCIGCKACEVACKQWNDLPTDEVSYKRGASYDHTGELTASTWRHVRFVEVSEPTKADRDRAQAMLGAAKPGPPRGNLPNIPAAHGGRPAVGLGGDGGLSDGDLGDLNLVDWADGGGTTADLDRWVFMSDVCKHCTNAGCMDACPTGALIRTEFETVIVQPDVCNGCGYCVPSCPFGVIDRDHDDGRAAKCTLCYDRLEDGLEPACAKACPTDSIQFGPYDELVDIAKRRVARLHEDGVSGAYLYGAGDPPEQQLAGGLGAFFLLTEPPERFGLPANADSPIQENVVPATVAAFGAGLMAAAAVAAAFVFPELSHEAVARRARALRRRRRAW